MRLTCAPALLPATQPAGGAGGGCCQRSRPRGRRGSGRRGPQHLCGPTAQHSGARAALNARASPPLGVTAHVFLYLLVSVRSPVRIFSCCIRVFEHSAVRPRIFAHLRVSPRISTYLRVSPRISAYQGAGAIHVARLAGGCLPLWAPAAAGAGQVQRCPGLRPAASAAASVASTAISRAHCHKPRALHARTCACAC